MCERKKEECERKNEECRQKWRRTCTAQHDNELPVPALHESGHVRVSGQNRNNVVWGVWGTSGSYLVYMKPNILRHVIAHWLSTAHRIAPHPSSVSTAHRIAPYPSSVPHIA
eukprot:1218191-Rhodomonas_salina.1